MVPAILLISLAHILAGALVFLAIKIAIKWIIVIWFKSSKERHDDWIKKNFRDGEED